MAFLGGTSTLVVQDPAASLRRQLRACQDKLPPGWFIAAHYWDIESGGLDLRYRGHGSAHEHVNVGIPRDGGLAALLAEAAGGMPTFAAVVCEDIERSGRDTCNALKLEHRLRSAGIPLFATDEPISVEGANATTVLVRRAKQGGAEWYRLQIKEKAWAGLREAERKAMLADTLPANAVEQAAQRAKQATRLRKQLRRIEAAQESHVRELDEPSGPSDPAARAWHARIRTRFAELEAERSQNHRPARGAGGRRRRRRRRRPPGRIAYLA